jgi:hypothetical protein
MLAHTKGLMPCTNHLISAAFKGSFSGYCGFAGGGGERVLSHVEALIQQVHVLMCKVTTYSNRRSVGFFALRERRRPRPSGRRRKKSVNYCTMVLVYCNRTLASCYYYGAFKLGGMGGGRFCTPKRAGHIEFCLMRQRS